MKNVNNEVKNEPILNNEYTNDTNDRSPLREMTPCAANQDNDDITSIKTHDQIVVAPFKAESKKQTLSENQKTHERTKLLSKRKNI